MRASVRISACCTEYSGVSISNVNAPIFLIFLRLVSSVKMKGVEGMRQSGQVSVEGSPAYQSTSVLSEAR